MFAAVVYMAHVLIVLSAVVYVFADTFQDDSAEICLSNIDAQKCPFYGRLRNIEAIDIDPAELRVFEILDDGSQVDAKSLKLPGRYLLDFGKITVNQDLDFLIGDISIRLGDFIQAVPSAGVACAEGATLICDHQSQGLASFGLAENFGLCLPGHVSSCRYCDICQTAKNIEDDLAFRKVLPNVGAGEQQFQNNCASFSKNQQYRLTRRIELPSLNQLDLNWLRTANSDRDQQVANEFKRKTGKLVIKLNLLNKVQQPYCKIQQFCQSAIIAKLFAKACDGCDTTSDCQKASGDDRSRFDLVACYDIQFNFDFQPGPPDGSCQGGLALSPDSPPAVAIETTTTPTAAPPPRLIVADNRIVPLPLRRVKTVASRTTKAADPCEGQAPWCCACRFCVAAGCSRSCTQQTKCG